MGQLAVVFEILDKTGQVSEDKKGDSTLERKIWIIRVKKTYWHRKNTKKKSRPK